jgi:FkbM family methyltransferase
MKNTFGTGTLNYIWNHPACKNQQFQSITKFLAWQAYKRITRKTLDFQVIPGVKLRCYPDSRSASAALYCGLYDYHDMSFLLRYLQPADTFLDVGANIGIYSLLAASILKQGQVHSFEVLPKNCQRFNINLALNQVNNVILHTIAIADRPGEILLNLAEGDSMPFITQQPTEHTISVKSDTLDNLLKHEPTQPITLGKIDIEGAELLAFKGATSLLQKQSPPVWIIELLDFNQTTEHSPPSVVSLLQEFGYDLYSFDADTNQLSPAQLSHKTGNNLLAIATAKLDFVRDRLARNTFAPSLRR